MRGFARGPGPGFRPALLTGFALFLTPPRAALLVYFASQEMCVPISREELHAAVVDMDVDRNGLIELTEFTQYFVSLGFGDGGEGEGAAAAMMEASDDSEVRAYGCCCWPREP
jgi:hypothetical protein